MSEFLKSWSELGSGSWRQAHKGWLVDWERFRGAVDPKDFGGGVPDFDLMGVGLQGSGVEVVTAAQKTWAQLRGDSAFAGQALAGGVLVENGASGAVEVGIIRMPQPRCLVTAFGEGREVVSQILGSAMGSKRDLVHPAVSSVASLFRLQSVDGQVFVAEAILGRRMRDNIIYLSDGERVPASPAERWDLPMIGILRTVDHPEPRLHARVMRRAREIDFLVQMPTYPTWETFAFWGRQSDEEEMETVEGMVGYGDNLVRVLRTFIDGRGRVTWENILCTRTNGDGLEGVLARLGVAHAIGEESNEVTRFVARMGNTSEAAWSYEAGYGGETHKMMPTSQVDRNLLDRYYIYVSQSEVQRGKYLLVAVDRESNLVAFADLAELELRGGGMNLN